MKPWPVLLAALLTSPAPASTWRPEPGGLLVDTDVSGAEIWLDWEKTSTLARLPLTSRLVLVSTEPEARVELEDRIIGQTPIPICLPTRGSVEFALRAPAGFESIRIALDDHSEAISLALKPSPWRGILSPFPVQLELDRRLGESIWVGARVQGLRLGLALDTGTWSPER